MQAVSVRQRALGVVRGWDLRAWRASVIMDVTR